MYGMPYGYGYGGGSPVMAIIITVLALGAIIALSIFCFVKFMGKDGDKSSRLGELFDMKKLYLEKFIKILYMISAVGCAVFGVVTPFLLWAVTGRFLMFLAGIFIGAISIVIGEVLCRLGYEYTYMFVRIAGDTRAIRTHFEGEPKE
ncbi:MAG: DUF4282 domain-containing protein [Eggerthellaceae bacterium]|nr:DUF4282 domain-containing protein [Eggerthellaceae bacterium]